jgi:anti-sigma factor RsiW
MELIGLFSVVVMPWLVKGATSYVKQVGPVPMLPHRVLVVRAIVAVLALAGAVLSVWLGDLNQVDGALVETAALAVFNALVATWLYVSEK